MLLAGDVGGTKTDLAIISPSAGPRAPLARAELPSARYPSLAALVRAFLATVDLPVERACFDVAGPVIRGRAKITNLPWEVEEEQLARELGLASVCLLNDLEAIAYAIPRLGPDDLRTLNPGEPDPAGALAVIAPGTGLGEAFLTRDGAGYRAHPSEGGHADFAPTDALQVGLLQYMLERYEHVSYERVCSGQGIPHLYQYLKERGAADEDGALAARIAGAADPTPHIVQAGLDPSAGSPLCAAALDLFVAILGAEAGNLALKVLATGGVYLAGGIPPRILPRLADGRFMQAFCRKGRFADLLARVPVHVVVAEAALLGAAFYGLEHPEGRRPA
jgi:glucokinase